MAKKRKTPAQPGQDWNAPAAELAVAHVREEPGFTLLACTIEAEAYLGRL